MYLASLWDILHALMWVKAAIAIFLAAPLPSALKKVFADAFLWLYQKGLSTAFLVYSALLVFMLYDSYREMMERQAHNDAVARVEDKDYERFFRAQRNCLITSFSLILLVIINGFQNLLAEAAKANLNLAVLRKQAEGQQAGLKALEKEKEREKEKEKEKQKQSDKETMSTSSTSTSPAASAGTEMSKEEMAARIRQLTADKEGLLLQLRNSQESFTHLLKHNDEVESKISANNNNRTNKKDN